MLRCDPLRETLKGESDKTQESIRHKKQTQTFCKQLIQLLFIFMYPVWLWKSQLYQY